MIFKKRNIIILLLGVLCLFIGFFIGKSYNPSTENIASNELAIYSDFFEADPLVYSNSNDEEYIETKIALTDKGEKYVSTHLFEEDYDVNIFLINNKNDKEYLSFLNLEWNINKSKDIRILLQRENITDKDLLSDFDSQIKN